jgi:murein DD-endopeptidase MepM/ murein hydrolase activator NlpD
MMGILKTARLSSSAIVHSHTNNSGFRYIKLRAACALITITLAISGIPGGQIALAGPNGGYVYPVMSPRLSSKFGNRRHPVLKATKHHSGVDLAAPKGALIRAIQSGRVIFADPHGGYGKLIVIRHENGLTSHYGHCDQLKVDIGASVRAGQIIGTVGRTGRVTGPHLHFEIRKEGNPLDPMKFIPDIAKNGMG